MCLDTVAVDDHDLDVGTYNWREFSLAACNQEQEDSLATGVTCADKSDVQKYFDYTEYPSGKVSQHAIDFFWIEQMISVN